MEGEIKETRDGVDLLVNTLEDIMQDLHDLIGDYCIDRGVTIKEIDDKFKEVKDTSKSIRKYTKEYKKSEEL